MNWSSQEIDGRALSGETMSALVCPSCRTSLLSAGEGLACQKAECGKLYPVVGGIPILIDEANSVFEISDFLSERDTYFLTDSPIKRVLRRLVPEISKNLKARKNYAMFAHMVSQSHPSPRVLILGGSDLGEGIEMLLRHPEIELIESDVAFGPRVKIILDGHGIPFQDGLFDGVIAQAVLEHVVDPYKVVEEIYRVMKVGGVVYAETPFMQQVHGGRYDFTRFTHLGHRRLFRRFAETSSGAVNGTGMAMAWSYKYFMRSLTNNPMIQRCLVAFAAFTSFFMKYLDHLTIDRPASLDGASGLYFLGRKSLDILTDRDLIRQYRGSL